MTIEELMHLVNVYGASCVQYGKYTHAFSLTRAAEDTYAAENAVEAAGQARTAIEQALLLMMEKHHVVR